MDAKRPGYPLFPAFTPALVGGCHTTEFVGVDVSGVACTVSLVLAVCTPI